MDWITVTSLRLHKSQPITNRTARNTHGADAWHSPSSSEISVTGQKMVICFWWETALRHCQRWSYSLNVAMEICFGCKTAQVRQNHANVFQTWSFGFCWFWHLWDVGFQFRCYFATTGDSELCVYLILWNLLTCSFICLLFELFGGVRNGLYELLV